LIDNSPTNELKILDIDSRIAFIIQQILVLGLSNVWRLTMKLGAKYHFIVNPDIYFEGDVLLLWYNMADDMTIGMMMPQVLNEDGSVQNFKLLPSPFCILKGK
jgi:hypothetical protein